MGTSAGPFGDLVWLDAHGGELGLPIAKDALDALEPVLEARDLARRDVRVRPMRALARTRIRHMAGERRARRWCIKGPMEVR